MHNYYWQIVFAFFLVFVSPNFHYGQCPENIQLVGNNRLKLQFDSKPNPKPVFLIFEEDKFTLNQAGNSGNYFTESAPTFTGSQNIDEFELHYNDSNDQCFYSEEGINIEQSLPVEFISFEGEFIAESVELIWSTASEKENEGFEVEQSFDGKQFENIDFIQGAGFSETIQYYRYTDQSIDLLTADDIIYYRLVQIDFDGTKDYSDLLAINLHLDKSSFEISKVTGFNSMDQSINIHFQVPEYIERIDFLLVDVSGRTLGMRSVYPEPGKNILKLDLKGYQNNILFLSASDGKELISKKIALSH